MSQPADDYRGLALAITAVAELVAPPLAGYWLDARYGWSPWGLAVGGVLGFGGGLAHLTLVGRRAERAAKTDGTGGRTPPTTG